MTLEAPDLSLRLPRRHFFCACMYSPPRPHALFPKSLRSFAPPVVLCMSFCAHSLPLSHTVFPVILRSFALPACRVVSAVGLLRGAAQLVFACELVGVLFLEF
jgi:hypothetical protein